MFKTVSFVIILLLVSGLGFGQPVERPSLEKDIGKYNEALRYPEAAKRYEKLPPDYYRQQVVYRSESLIIQQVSKHSYRHISFLETKQYGKVGCNGMILIDQDSAVVVDAPVKDEVSAELLHWLSDSMLVKPKAIVVTHFHIDCLGGLKEFHRRGIPSIAYFKTLALAKQDGAELPQHSFDSDTLIQLGSKTLVLTYPGEGHTRDNSVVYCPEERVLFGGCLVKSNGSGKGNLADANTDSWPKTVATLKARFAQAVVVIPGHGPVGGIDLLDYTQKLFEK